MYNVYNTHLLAIKLWEETGSFKFNIFKLGDLGNLVKVISANCTFRICLEQRVQKEVFNTPVNSQNWYTLDSLHNNTLNTNTSVQIQWAILLAIVNIYIYKKRILVARCTTERKREMNALTCIHKYTHTKKNIYKNKYWKPVIRSGETSSR